MEGEKPIVCDAGWAINREKWGQIEEIKWDRKNDEVRASCHKTEPFVNIFQTKTRQTQIQR